MIPARHHPLIRTRGLITVLILATTALGAETPTPTWARDVGPLLQRRCADCHHPGGAAPFPLQAYRHAAKRANFLLEVVESGLMPPWKADPAYRSFANERLLSPDELATLRRWAAAGLPAGDTGASSAFASPLAAATDEPDLVLRMPRPYPLPAGTKSVFICVKIPYELARDTFVRATDFIPGDRKRVHHASYQILEVDDDVDTRAGPDVEVYSDTTGENPDDARQFAYFRLIGRGGKAPRLVFHTGWLPGSSPQKYPPGMGFRLPRKGVLLIRSLHYSPAPKAGEDQSAVRLWFAHGPIDRKVEFAAFKPEIALPRNRKPGDPPLMIPAGKVVRYEIDNEVPYDVSLLAVNPHMHLLGRSFKVYAVKPAGDTVPLVNVPRWDFNWQEFYRFRTLVHLPKGSRLRAEAWFDNTSKNLQNPYLPPRDVYFERGMAETDEMMRLVMQYVMWRPGDEAITQQP